MYSNYSIQDPRLKDRLTELQSSNDVPERWRGTSIEHFIQAQNFGYPLHSNGKPQVLISTCIDFRYSLPVPHHYAYVIRTAGGRLIGQEFAVSYILSKGVRNILLIAHDDCGMAKVRNHLPDLSNALVEQGWPQEKATDFVHKHSEFGAIDDEVDALEREYHRLKKLFRDIRVAPLFLTIADKRVHVPRWYIEHINGNNSAQAAAEGT